MTTKVVKVLKYLGLFSIVFFTIISCEKEIESIGVNLVDNNNFDTNKLTTEVITENENVERVISNGVPQYLLGVYSDIEFGKLKASIVSQLTLPLTVDGYDYGTNASIDSVLIDIPYQSTASLENYSDGKPKFELDSVFGDASTEFQLKVYELKTFLNTLDPEDPTKSATYYSDKEFMKADTPLFVDNFKVNPDDTVTYIKRYMPDGSVYAIDTLKKIGITPSIKIPLNETMIQQLFVDNASSAEFSSEFDFQHYFRGLYIEAEELLNDQSHIISLDMSNANMTIYYSNDEDEGEGVDLNDNGITGEQGVRISQEYVFTLGTIRSNVFKRDDTTSKASGEDRLYVQGAAGSIAKLEILSSENIVDLQNSNWLITDASLTIYVDQNASSDIVPEQLFVYNYDENSQLLDMLTEGITSIGGSLERDDDGKPYRYVFKITDYISELLTSDEPLDLVTLGLKVYEITDTPSSFADTAIKNFSWSPKGVVLYGNDLNAGDKKPTFEISYAEINN
ncbi:MAG: DUF4270 domain-containing protein [Lutibacter sp.]|uniref:DUF4270 domain-containing protein n=1 Tax=Lutibacter sp. TaxID=1925666 RepID=UPI0018319B75|nr:DUF4270 domain-containing protein [Lutibacter sp.]MBT8318302.1 DUF4270 domain-containing protein [Lutibacter sp.]NNJ59159.1 DUF4270 domain-containing protein [Lutibacter sp.]